MYFKRAGSRAATLLKLSTSFGFMIDSYQLPLSNRVSILIWPHDCLDGLDYPHHIQCTGVLYNDLSETSRMV